MRVKLSGYSFGDKGKFEMILKLVVSGPDIFNIGVIAVVLKDVGTVPLAREEWMITIIRGTRDKRQACTRYVRRRSSW